MASNVIARVQCAFRGHEPGRDEFRSLALHFARCKNCGRGLMMNRNFPDTALPMDEKRYAEAIAEVKEMNEMYLGVLANIAEEEPRDA